MQPNLGNERDADNPKAIQARTRAGRDLTFKVDKRPSLLVGHTPIMAYDWAESR
jgi:hypothetical protein